LGFDPDSQFKARLQRQAGATNETELHFILMALIQSGDLAVDLDLNDLGQTEWDVTGLQIRLTPQGWAVVQDELHGVRGTCFVAMSFEPQLVPLYERAIEPAVVTDCKLRVVRLDRVEHNDNINDRIMADIRQSEVLVADFTNHKGGVYFEAGFALGLERTVVFTCREDQFSAGAGVHFDTRPYNHLLWSPDSLDEFRTKLSARLQNTVHSLKDASR
jgi:nucleoside 2-deoxyribosyltransferase